MGNYFQFTDITKIVQNRRKDLLRILGVSILIGAIVASPLIMTPRYESTAIVYPTSLSNYSIETSTEQMLQILESEDIMRDMIKKFKLGEHYDIDSTSKHYYSNVKMAYEENVSIEKTLYESVEIEITDENPETAYNMVNELINLYNLKTRELHRTKAKEVLVIAKDQLERKDRELDSLTKEIQKLRLNYGILEYDVQTSEATRRYIRSLGGSGKAVDKELITILKNLEEKGEDFQKLKAHIYAARGAYEGRKGEYEKALMEVNKELTYASVVTSPVVPDKKSWPIRWLVVLIFAVGGFISALVFFIYFDKPLTGGEPSQN